MSKQNNIFVLFLIAGEVLLITYLDYLGRGTFYSLEVLYCLPVIQAAPLGAIHAMRRSDTQIPTVVAVTVALIWSLGEVAVVWPEFPWAAFALNVFTRSVTFTVIGRVMAKLWKEREFAFKDPLTRLANRVDFFDRFEIERARSARTGKPYSFLFIDVDRFKMLNDQRGHQVGDQALKALADILTANSRRIDIVARFGGDEFVLVLPDTDEAACTFLVERIRQAADEEFARRGWPISLSIGGITEIGDRLSANEIVREADAKMYSAKKERLQAESAPPAREKFPTD